MRPLALAIARRWVPVPIRKRKLLELFALTAGAFGAGMPRSAHALPFHAYLREYALFTRAQAEELLATAGPSSERVAATKARLYESSEAWAQGLRRLLGVKTETDAFEALETLYGLLEIDAACDGLGELTISRCYFKDFYSADVCSLISALDDGVARGLTGRNLRFEQRLTEGCGCCRAQLSTEERL